jgi:hypothetical protein
VNTTNALQKLWPSLINAAVVFAIATPLYSVMPLALWKSTVVAFFLMYNLFFLLFAKNRCLGMMLAGTRWKRRAKFSHELLFVFLYTLSFSTLMFSVWFPFDIFLANIFLLQLPTVLATGTTLHGYLSGNKVSVVASR